MMKRPAAIAAMLGVLCNKGRGADLLLRIRHEDRVEISMRDCCVTLSQCSQREQGVLLAVACRVVRCKSGFDRRSLSHPASMQNLRLLRLLSR